MYNSRMEDDYVNKQKKRTEKKKGNYKCTKA
jgi:hypothetical protein